MLREAGETSAMEPERAAILECLAEDALESGLALAEVRWAQRGDEEAAVDLARVLFRSGDPAAALMLLEGRSGPALPSPAALLLRARAALGLERLGTAEEALSQLLYPSQPSASTAAHSGTSPAASATTAHAHHLLGDVFARTNRLDLAKQEWRAALRINPYLWPAFSALAHSGDHDAADPDELFRHRKSLLARSIKLETPEPCSLPKPPRMLLETPDTLAQLAFSPALVQLSIESPMEQNQPDSDSHSIPAESPPLAPQQLPPKAPRKTRKVSSQTVGGGVGPLGRRSTRSSRILGDENTTHAGLPADTGNGAPLGTRRSPRFSASNNENSERRRAQPSRPAGLRSNNSGSSNLSRASLDSLPAERSTRHSQRRLIHPSPSEEARDKPAEELQDAKDPLPPVPPTLTVEAPPRPPSAQPPEREVRSRSVVEERPVLNGLAQLGRIWLELGGLRWEAALSELDALSAQLRKAPEVLVAEARCHFELADYGRSVEIFQELRRRHPWHCRGLELFSTALWHLQDSAQLSALAQSLLAEFQERAETWCVLGNALSLQKDHERAVRFLERAVQLKPLPYAYTLLGHELLALERLDKAALAFRTAARLSPRHYNAFFGLGELHKRAEQLPLARLHFRKALDLNPTNPILQCQLAEVEAGLGRGAAALEILGTTAHPVSRYHRAQLLLASGNAEEALAELEELKRLTPRESRVFFLSGKILARLGQQHLSLVDYTWATELEPRGEAPPPSRVANAAPYDSADSSLLHIPHDGPPPLPQPQF